MTKKIESKFEYVEGAVLRVDGEEKKFASKSEMFKFMYQEGATVAEIAALTKAHYSFVYGVISSKFELQKVDKDSKSETIRRLVDAGKTPGEIAKELNSNYSFVHSVVKKYKQEKETKAAAAAK